MRRLVVGLTVSLLAVAPSHARAQSSQSSAYLRWTAAEAERVGKGMRVNGRVGGAFDLRVIHTERSYNYKLRATWLTTEVIQAAARLAQLSERLSDEQTESLVREATAAGEGSSSWRSIRVKALASSRQTGRCSSGRPVRRRTGLPGGTSLLSRG